MPRPTSSGYAGVTLPAPARRRAWPTTSPCASCSSARSGRSGPTRSSRPTPRRCSIGDGGVNHTDHRAAGLAAVDAVYPAARNPMAFPSLARVRSRGAHGPPALPLLVGAARHLGRHLARRSIASSRRWPSIAARSATPTAWQAGSGSGPPRRADPIGVTAAEALRLIVIDDDEEDESSRAERPDVSGLRARPAAAAGCGPSGSRPRPAQSARRPSIATSSPRVRSPATPARCSAAATSTSLNSSTISALGRPVAHRASGRGPRSPGPATGRAATGRARRPSRRGRRSDSRARTARG